MLRPPSGVARAVAGGAVPQIALQTSMDKRKEHSSLEELNARLREVRKKADAAAGRSRRGAGAQSGLAQAMRIGVELVATLIVGGGIGLLLDHWLETTPWLMLVFFILGAAAGMINIYRVMTSQGQSIGYRQTRKKDD